MAPQTGAQVIAQALHDLGITVVFGLVGIPVVEIAEEAIKLGIRFIAFRNEQAASYAASAYGYLTGRPGVCLVVGGPGVLHAMAGVGRWGLLLRGSANRLHRLVIRLLITSLCSNLRAHQKHILSIKEVFKSWMLCHCLGHTLDLRLGPPLLVLRLSCLKLHSVRLGMADQVQHSSICLPI